MLTQISTKLRPTSPLHYLSSERITIALHSPLCNSTTQHRTAIPTILCFRASAEHDFASPSQTLQSTPLLNATHNTLPLHHVLYVSSSIRGFAVPLLDDSKPCCAAARQHHTEPQQNVTNLYLTITQTYVALPLRQSFSSIHSNCPCPAFRHSPRPMYRP